MRLATVIALVLVRTLDNAGRAMRGILGRPVVPDLREEACVSGRAAGASVPCVGGVPGASNRHDYAARSGPKAVRPNGQVGGREGRGG